VAQYDFDLFTIGADGSRFRWITAYKDHDVRATQPSWVATAAVRGIGSTFSTIYHASVRCLRKFG